MENVTAVALGTAIAGLLSPFLTALLNQPAFTTSMRSITATVVSLVLGVGSMWLTGGFDSPPLTWAVPVLAVVGVSQALYALVLKPTKAVESLTALRSIPALDEAAEKKAA